MSSKNVSRRKEINEYLALRRIKDLTDNSEAVIKNNYIYTYSMRYNYRAYYICELYITEIGESIFVGTDNLNLYLYIFTNFNLSNDIDQDINIEFKERINIIFDKNKIELCKYNDTNRYSQNDKEKEILSKRKYYQSIQKYLVNEINYELSGMSMNKIDNDLFNIKEIFEGNLRQTRHIKNIESEINSLKNNLIEQDMISAHISDIKISDNYIKLVVEADDIIHEEKLIYSFKEPLEENSLFLKFIDKMDVKSIDELELLPVEISRYSNSLSPNSRGWYISKRVDSNDNNDKNIMDIVKNYISVF